MDRRQTVGERVEMLSLRLRSAARKMGAGSLLLAAGAVAGALLLATTLVFPSSTIGRAVGSLREELPRLGSTEPANERESVQKTTEPAAAAAAAGDTAAPATNSSPVVTAAAPSTVQETLVLSSGVTATETGPSRGGSEPAPDAPSLATNEAKPGEATDGANDATGDGVEGSKKERVEPEDKTDGSGNGSAPSQGSGGAPAEKHPPKDTEGPKSPPKASNSGQSAPPKKTKGSSSKPPSDSAGGGSPQPNEAKSAKAEGPEKSEKPAKSGKSKN